MLALRFTICVFACALLWGAAPNDLCAEEQVHLTREEALDRAFPGRVRIERAPLEFSVEERKALARDHKIALGEGSPLLLRAFDRKGRLIGYAMFVEEIGKFRPISFVVALTPEREVRDVAVTVYRESHGGEITRRRFLKQFRGKEEGDRLRLGREIIHISGAPLSCRATIRAVDRVLTLVDHHCDAQKGLSALRFTEVVPEIDALPARSQASALPEPFPTARRIAMGTVLEVTIDADEDLAALGIEAVFDEVESVRARLDGRSANSDIAKILTAPPGRHVPVSTETIECLSKALEIARLSDGAFDPTLRDAAWQEISIDRDAQTVRRSAAVTQIDLGGIGKGYALDRAAARLRELGATRALLNFGGQILALDPPRGTTGWSVAIASPRNDGSVFAVEELSGTSLACSGAMHRGDHIIDPRTGAAAEIPALTAVYASDAMTADAWSTVTAIAPGAIEASLRQVPALREVRQLESVRAPQRTESAPL